MVTFPTLGIVFLVLPLLGHFLPSFLCILSGPDPSVSESCGTGIQTNTLAKAYVYFV